MMQHHLRGRRTNVYESALSCTLLFLLGHDLAAYTHTHKAWAIWERLV